MISSDGKYVQLWDLLTDLPVGNSDLEARCERQRELGQKVKNNLNKVARVHGQEYEMSVDDHGVTLTTMSCFEGADRFIVRVYIPADRKQSIRVDIGPGHKATMWKWSWKPGKVWKQIVKCVGRIR
jgi:hypothetical protein